MPCFVQITRLFLRLLQTVTSGAPEIVSSIRSTEFAGQRLAYVCEPSSWNQVRHGDSSLHSLLCFFFQLSAVFCYEIQSDRTSADPVGNATGIPGQHDQCLESDRSQ